MIRATAKKVEELFSRSLAKLELAVLMLDGVDVGGHAVVIDGAKALRRAVTDVLGENTAVQQSAMSLATCPRPTEGGWVVASHKHTILLRQTKLAGNS